MGRETPKETVTERLRRLENIAIHHDDQITDHDDKIDRLVSLQIEIHEKTRILLDSQVRTEEQFRLTEEQFRLTEEQFRLTEEQMRLTEEQMRQTAVQIAQVNFEGKERDRLLDERVNNLVSAIGEFLRRSGK
jgi:hypothetical protein